MARKDMMEELKDIKKAVENLSARTFAGKTTAQQVNEEMKELQARFLKAIGCDD